VGPGVIIVNRVTRTCSLIAMSVLGTALLMGCGNKKTPESAGANAASNAALQQSKPGAAQSTDLAPAPSGASTDLSGGRK
jgi:hypothetical protein